MKALVLCGGIPQIELLKQLKDRGIYTILADMNKNVTAREYADKFYPVSVLDVEAIEKVAILEKVDMIITVCADQVLLVCAEISERLNLPCYLDFETAKNVSDKELMKKIFAQNGIPSSQYIILEDFDKEKITQMKYPLIIKPVDSYSSRGVKKVSDLSELKDAFVKAKKISRSNKVIIEEYVQGVELSIDAYVENGIAHILCVSQLDKIPDANSFVINRLTYPARVNGTIQHRIEKVVQNIVGAFKLTDTPLLVQLIYNEDNEISVLEFCARTGGGDKFRLIKNVTGFDVIKAVIDLTLGEKPYVPDAINNTKFIIDEFVYCNEGVLDHMEGFEEQKDKGIISEYFQLKQKGAEFGKIKSSGDRVAYFTVQGNTKYELEKKYNEATQKIRIIDFAGNDIVRRDLFITNYNKGDKLK